jgi:hypothetical protein
VLPPGYESTKAARASEIRLLGLRERKQIVLEA